LPRWIGHDTNPGFSITPKPGRVAVSSPNDPGLLESHSTGFAAKPQPSRPSLPNAPVAASVAKATILKATVDSSSAQVLHSEIGAPARQTRSEAAVAQVVRLAQDQPQMVAAFFNNDAAKPISIGAIDVSELAWAPLNAESETTHEPEK